LKILKEVSNDNIYGVEFVQILIEYIWEFYATQIRWKMFYPFIAELIIAHIYFVVVIYQPSNPLAFDILTAEFWLRNIVLVLTGLFASLEFVQMYDEGIDYIYDPFNYLNLGSALFNTLICMVYGYNIAIIGEEHLAIMCSVAALFLWANALYWMRFFENTAHYVRMITTTISDIAAFLYIQALFMLMFGFTIFFIN